MKANEGKNLVEGLEGKEKEKEVSINAWVIQCLRMIGKSVTGIYLII